MRLKFVGTADVRSISKSEWPDGIVHDKVVWDKSNDFTAEVSKEAGEWLLEHEPDDWKDVSLPSERAIK